MKGFSTRNFFIKDLIFFLCSKGLIDEVGQHQKYMMEQKRKHTFFLRKFIHGNVFDVYNFYVQFSWDFHKKGKYGTNHCLFNTAKKRDFTSTLSIGGEEIELVEEMKLQGIVLTVLGMKKLEQRMEALSVQIAQKNTP